MSKIDIGGWKRFNLYDENLFNVDMGNKFDKAKMTQLNPSINFVGRSNSNNGIIDFVDEIRNVEPYKAGNITISMGGYVGACFVQPKPFYTSQNVCVLIPQNAQMTDNAKKFITAMIFKESQTYYKAFVDELNRHIRTDFSIFLPVDTMGVPDWKYMDRYIANLEKSLLNALNCFITFANTENKVVDTGNWREFNIGDLFEIINGKGITKDELYKHPGEIIAIQSGEDDNGCIGMIDEKYCKAMNYHIEYKPALTVARSGSSGFITFQDKPFVVGDSAKILKPKFRMNKAQFLFLRVVLMELKKKFSYKDKVSTERYKAETIKLPVTNTGKIDFDYMEKYISSLEIAVSKKLDNLQKIVNDV